MSGAAQGGEPRGVGGRRGPGRPRKDAPLAVLPTIAPKPKQRRALYPEVLTTEEACDFLAISAELLQALRDAHGLPFRKIGERKYLYSRRALVAWVEGDLQRVRLGPGEWENAG